MACGGPHIKACFCFYAARWLSLLLWRSGHDGEVLVMQKGKRSASCSIHYLHLDDGRMTRRCMNSEGRA